MLSAVHMKAILSFLEANLILRSKDNPDSLEIKVSEGMPFFIISQ